MTREEAIERLNIHKSTSVFVDSIAEAIDMAIEALSDRPTDEWCTDCKEYDQEKHCCPRFNRVIRTTLNEVVRCKDCRYYWGNLGEDDTDEMYGECRWDSDEMPNADDFCSYGERREP